MAGRYYTPGKQQLFSAYTPIPIEFYQQQLDKRDQAYRQSALMLSSAEDSYGGMDVRGADVTGKNAMIEGYFNKIHDNVKSKYSGDYGKAYVDIVQNIGKFNKDPRIQAYKEAYETDKAMRNQMLNAQINNKLLTNPNYDAFNTPVKYDESTGKVEMPDYANTFMEKPNYVGILSNTISKLSNMKNEQGVSSYKGDIDGLLQSISTSGTPEKEIEKFVNTHPELVNNFINETGKAFEWDQQFAGDPKKAKDFVINRLKESVAFGINRNYLNEPGFSTKPKSTYKDYLDRMLGDASDYKNTRSSSNPLGLIKPTDPSITPIPDTKGNQDPATATGTMIAKNIYKNRQEQGKKTFGQEKLDKQNTDWKPWVDQYGSKYVDILNDGIAKSREYYTHSTNLPVEQTNYIEEKLSKGLTNAEFIIEDKNGKDVSRDLDELINELGLVDKKKNKTTLDNTNQLKKGLSISGIYESPTSPYYGGFRAEYGNKHFVIKFSDPQNPLHKISEEIRTNKESLRTRQTQEYKIPGFKNATVSGIPDIDPETGVFGIQQLHIKIGQETFNISPFEYDALINQINQTK